MTIVRLDSMVATLYKPTQSVPITTDNCEVNCVPWQGILWSNSPSFIDDDCYLWLLLKKKTEIFCESNMGHP